LWWIKGLNESKGAFTLTFYACVSGIAILIYTFIDKFFLFFIFFGVPRLATFIFLIFYNKPESGAEIDPGMVLTTLPSSIGLDGD
jgi:hypothetical protein